MAHSGAARGTAGRRGAGAAAVLLAQLLHVCLQCTQQQQHAHAKVTELLPLCFAPPLPPPRFWDYHSGHCYQQVDPVVQPGSLESEAGVYAAAYDVTGTRLITCNADKTIQCYKVRPRARARARGWRRGPAALRARVGVCCTDNSELTCAKRTQHKNSLPFQHTTPPAQPKI